VFRSLGLEIEIRPVLEDTRDEDSREESDEGDDLVGTELHDIQVWLGGYDERRPTEVRSDPSVSSRQYSPYW
jgi:hypothetical protein